MAKVRPMAKLRTFRFYVSLVKRSQIAEIGIETAKVRGQRAKAHFEGLPTASVNTVFLPIVVSSPCPLKTRVAATIEGACKCVGQAHSASIKATLLSASHTCRYSIFILAGAAQRHGIC
jgi:hypothetical protein